MAEVLSQNEIDALLNALDTGEVDVKEIKEESKEKKIKNYDFRNPQKIAKDQLRTLEIIHENFGRLLQTFLSGYLRAAIRVEVLTVDQFAYSEFSNAISNPAFLSIVNFDPLPGEIIFDISPKVALATIDRLLGGDGQNIKKVRNFTEIELTLLKKLVRKMNNLLSEAWENVIELKPSLEKIETNPQFAQIVSPSETIALITLNISIGEVEGMINICIPHVVIESILDRLSTKLWFTRSKRDEGEDNTYLLEERLKKANVLVKAELGSSVLTVSEILNLQAGDVITLNNYRENHVKMNIGKKMKFFGQPGRSGNKLAVKITSVEGGGKADG